MLTLHVIMFTALKNAKSNPSMRSQVAVLTI